MHKNIFGKVNQVHFVGIGGSGMSGIAEILHGMGFRVTGSDIHESEVTKRLRELGIPVDIGHNVDQVLNSDVVIYSSAVKPERDPEVLAASDRQIPVIRRAEMLGELMRLKNGIAIAGTHGKSTTTTMVGQILTVGGFDPTIIVGGIVKSFGSGAKLGSGDYLVVEADEYDRSFLRLSPVMAVVTNLEVEHLDCYKDLDEIKAAFVEFVNHVPFFGLVVFCIDNSGVQDIMPDVERRIFTYGLSPQADIRAMKISYTQFSSRFLVMNKDEELGEILLNVPGGHNVRNALASICVGLELDVPFDVIRIALEKFTTVRRRFELKGTAGGVMIVDDYAHHPTEIEASLRGAREGFDRRIIAVFQPHLYSRTKNFYNEFGRSFLDTDVLYVMDVYPAREEPIEGVTGELVARAAIEIGHRKVHYEPDMELLVEKLTAEVSNGDMVITFGAGDVNRVGDLLLKRLEKCDDCK